MRACPHCGHENEETAAICVQCNQALPPLAPPAQQVPEFSAPQAPVPLPAAQAPDTRRKGRQYLLGLGLGLIPLIAFLPGIGLSINGVNSDLATFLLISSLLLYIASIIAMILCLVKQSVRFVGYGLLTTVLASPVIGCIGCVVIASSLGRAF